MHSALLVIDKTEERPLPDSQWSVGGSQITDLLRSTRGVENLARYVWLIPLQDGQLTDLNRAGQIAASHNLKYRILFFHESPDWVFSYQHS